MAARTHQRSEFGQRVIRLGNMLEHFHAGDDVELRRCLRQQFSR